MAEDSGQYEIKDGLLITHNSFGSFVFRVKDIISYSVHESNVVLLVRDMVGTAPRFSLDTTATKYNEEHFKIMHELLKPLREAMNY